MDEKYEIDRLDRQILKSLRQDARAPYLDIARKLKVSGGTIHQRMDRLKKLEIVTGSQLKIDYSKLGYDVTAFLGIHLQSTRDLTKVIEQMKKLEEIIEVYYTTGNYALLIKVCTLSIKDFHLFLSEKLQNLQEIQSTESFICLDNTIMRDVPIDEMSK